MTTTRVTTYSADEITISFCGQLIDSGFADGEVLSIETASEDFGLKVGADGEVARFKTNNRSATTKLKTLQTSLGNNVLNAIRLRDLNNPNGAGVGLLEVRDRSSGVLVAHAPKSWISKPPTVSRGREISENEWTITSAHMDLDLSGNPSI